MDNEKNKAYRKEKEEEQAEMSKLLAEETVSRIAKAEMLEKALASGDFKTVANAIAGVK